VVANAGTIECHDFENYLTDRTPVLAQTIGIEMPNDFPTVPYNAVAGRLGGRYREWDAFALGALLQPWAFRCVAARDLHAIAPGKTHFAAKPG
jgi:hypothetical protein